MRKHPPIRLIVLCASAMGLAACQSISDGGVFGTAEKPLASCDSTNEHAQTTKLQKENAKLKRQLAETLQDNATLRDLASKKW